MKKLFLILLLACPLFARAAPLPPQEPPARAMGLPADVALNATNMIFYCYGYIAGLDMIAENAGQNCWPYHELASHNRVLASFFTFYPPFYAYLMGQADAFENEAELRGKND